MFAYRTNFSVKMRKVRNVPHIILVKKGLKGMKCQEKPARFSHKLYDYLDK